MGLPTSVDIKVNNGTVQILVFDTQEPDQRLLRQPVNIFASGPSISELDFSDKILNLPSFFVNGSIKLTAAHKFTHIAAYVISDARFIKHQPEILSQYYCGQPFYATLAVFEAMALLLPELLNTYHQSMRIIHPVDRPLDAQVNQASQHSLLGRFAITKLLHRKKPLTQFSSHPSFIIDSSDKQNAIGVSLDVTHGFVEAGTVAYVAAQLAYSLKASEIHLYGIDLINSNQPRFYETKDNSAPCKLDKAITDRIVPSFNLLGRAYRDHGVVVLNHSPVSKALFRDLDVGNPS